MTNAPLPPVVDRATWQAELDTLREKEKAHKRAGDEIAAARRRLPMVEVDASASLVGAQGPITLLEAFEGRSQLIAYYFMWYPGKPAEDQCEGCTLYTGQVRELAFLHSRDVTYATFCQARTRRASATRTSWAGTCRGTRSRTRPRRSWPAAPPTTSTSCATCGRATGSSRPTGRPAAASSRWDRATACSTSPCAGARRRGRTPPSAGPSPGAATSSRIPTARRGARSCSGRASVPDVPTISAPPGTEGSTVELCAGSGGGEIHPFCG